DGGLANFKDCKNLTDLILEGTQVGDTGLAHFKGCIDLMALNLHATQVSDAGLAHFKECKSLSDISISDTQITDEGLAYFKDCKNLVHLELQRTMVTAAGIEKLKKVLPQCRIESSFGTYGPTAAALPLKRPGLQFDGKSSYVAIPSLRLDNETTTVETIVTVQA